MDRDEAMRVATRVASVAAYRLIRYVAWGAVTVLFAIAVLLLWAGSLNGVLEWIPRW